MNRKYILALALATITTLVLAAPGAITSKKPMTYLLKSRGKTIAELRVVDTSACEFEVQPMNSSGWAEYDEASGSLTASNGATLKIISGTNSITVAADEIEGRPEAK